MRSKLTHSMITGILLMSFAFMFNACSTKSDIEETQWEVIQFNVKKTDWEWNDNAKQWEAIANLPELTEFVYENGVALGYVFFGTQGVDEVQKLLPYENITCDFQLGNPSTVGFAIKQSRLDVPQDYYFRIVLIW